MDCDTSCDAICILTGGILHESNTFNPNLTTLSDFRIRRGAEVMPGQSWAVFLQESGAEILPTVHAYARAYGVVVREAYEQLKQEILEGARRNVARISGIYLDLHGALHVDGYDDAQLDLVQSLRRIVHDDVLISASFDLHGNISPGLADALDLLTAYRTAPHIDAKETKTRAVRLLVEAIEKKQRPTIAHLNVPILIPGEKGVTSVEPLRSLYAQLPLMVEQHDDLLDASIFVGMAWTDIDRAGMSVQVVASDETSLPHALKEVERLAQGIWDHRHELIYDVATATLDGAIQTAMAAPESTVFITDSGDNPGAGGAGDNPFVLERLLAQGAQSAIFAGIADPEAVAVCRLVGVGGQVELTSVGGKVDSVFGRPLSFTGTVRFIKEAEANSKRRPVVVEVDGVLVVLLTDRRSFYTPQCFEEVAIDPLKHKIVVVKLGYLTQGLRDIAPRTIMAVTQGFTDQRIEELDYRHVRRPIYPLDPVQSWTASSTS